MKKIAYILTAIALLGAGFALQWIISVKLQDVYMIGYKQAETAISANIANGVLQGDLTLKANGTEIVCRKVEVTNK